MATRTIWHLISNRWNSAITEYALSAARALELAGFHSVFTCLQDSPAEARARSYGLETKPLYSFGLREIPRLRKWELDMQPHLVFVYGGPESFLAKVLRTPIVRFRGQDFGSGNVKDVLRQRLASSHVALLLTPSRQLEAAIKMATMPASPIVTVPLGCDANVFRPVPIGERQPIVTIFGRFDPVKGHAVGFRIFRKSLDHLQGMKAKLRVVGLPANLSEVHLREVAIQAGLTIGENIEFSVTKVDDLAALMSATAVGFVPSIGSEVICRVAEEFLLCGTAVIANNVGSLSECAYGSFGSSYHDEEVGALQLAAWLRKAMGESPADRELRARDAGRYFSLDAMADGLVEAVRPLLT